MDLVFSSFAPRTRAVIDVLVLPVILFWAVVFIYYGSLFAWESWQDSEISFSLVEATLWPVKAAIPVAGLVLFLQTMALWIRALHFAVTGREME